VTAVLPWFGVAALRRKFRALPNLIASSALGTRFGSPALRVARIGIEDLLAGTG
jgi:hypothetical protein